MFRRTPSRLAGRLSRTKAVAGRLTRAFLVTMFALWVPLGPCASLASAWIGVKPCCQATKLGCHGGDCGKKVESAARGCSCHSRTEIKSGLCACGHDNTGLVLNAEPVRPQLTAAFSPASSEATVSLPSFCLNGTREGPDIPPPISPVS